MEVVLNTYSLPMPPSSLVFESYKLYLKQVNTTHRTKQIATCHMGALSILITGRRAAVPEKLLFLELSCIICFPFQPFKMGKLFFVLSKFPNIKPTIIQSLYSLHSRGVYIFQKHEYVFVRVYCTTLRLSLTEKVSSGY